MIMCFKEKWDARSNVRTKLTKRYVELLANKLTTMFMILTVQCIL